MSEVSTIGLDLAKNVFQVHGANASGAIDFVETWVTVCTGHMGDTSRQACLAGGVECPGRSVRLWRSVFGSSRVFSTAIRTARAFTSAGRRSPFGPLGIVVHLFQLRLYV
jgi:hypothetical protein